MRLCIQAQISGQAPCKEVVERAYRDSSIMIEEELSCKMLAS